MKREKEVLAVIPARGGSKGIPRKNLARLCGRPLIQYTIDAAKHSELVSRVVLSSDDEEIMEYCKARGIEVPFRRPQTLAQDDTPMIDVIKHGVEFLEKSESYRPHDVVVLQPTSPLRTSIHIDKALSILYETEADSVVSVVEVPHQYNPVSVMKLTEGKLAAFLQGERREIYIRQHKPTLYARNGAAVYAIRYATFMQHSTLYGEDCRPLVMKPEESVDIDTIFDLKLAEFLLGRIRDESSLIGKSCVL